MYIHKRVPLIFTYCLLIAGLFSACYKKDIQVGSDLAESHTRIITVDTVSVVLSSYVLDSFITNNNKFALIGNYNDSYTGNTHASTFIQPGLPSYDGDITTLLPKSAEFDSIVLYMRPSGYYYGDTLKPFSISVFELAEQPEYDLTGPAVTYNTNNVPVKGAALGSWNKPIRPSFRDSIKIRLPDSIGKDFYTKLQTKATVMSTEAYFLDYFRGLTIQPSNSTGAAVYGFNLADSSIRVRIHFHHTLPYKVEKNLDFVLTRPSYQFNRIITDRNGTPLEPTTTGQHEFFSTITNPFAVTQSGTGVLLKAKFPALRDMLKINEVVRLMDAKLILKPVKGTYNINGNNLPNLPNPLSMQLTDASNSFKGQLLDTTGQGPQYRSPNIDFLYGTNTTYTFNITSYVNALLNSSGTAENGLFILESDPHASQQINRAVIGGRQNANYQTKLVLNLLTIE